MDAGRVRASTRCSLVPDRLEAVDQLGFLREREDPDLEVEERFGGEARDGGRPDVVELRGVRSGESGQCAADEGELLHSHQRPGRVIGGERSRVGVVRHRAHATRDVP